jgi:hypothetical protein
LARILDIGMLLIPPRGLDTDGVALIAARQRLDFTRHGCRE